MSAQENWRPIPGFEGQYDVSDQGRVRSLPRIVTRSDGRTRSVPGGILNPATRTSGHKTLQLGRSGGFHFVHRLVLSAFVGPRPDGYESCHGNGDPADNRLSNLRWDTRTNNHLDRVRHGTQWPARLTHCGRGHEFNVENTYINPTTGRRTCRTCSRVSVNEYGKRKRAERAS